MDELLRQTGQIIHGRESTSELIQRFEKSPNKQLIICLDEVDQLKNTDLLYVFARNSCCLVLISNYAFSPSRLDNRIKSRLHLHEIKVEPYESSRIQSILQDRIMDGMHDDAVNDELLEQITTMCNGDARTAIQILRNAAIEAESNGLDFITSQEIEIASKNVRRFRLSDVLKQLNDHQRILYDILRDIKQLNSGKLFEEYKKKADETVTDRSYRNYMQKLVEFGIVREISAGRWKRYEIV